MSELLISKIQLTSIRRGLLANASLLALLGYFGASQCALGAAGDDAPTVWIELGGQLERTYSPRDLFAPPFMDKTPADPLEPMISAQNPPPFSVGGEGRITFMPRNSDWVLSAGVYYGRSNSDKHLEHQTQIPYVKQSGYNQIFPQPGKAVFGDGQTSFKDTHAVLDFRAGKDVGLGLFGAGGTSIISAGVRFAQFTSSSNIALHARPEYKVGDVHHGTRIRQTYYGGTRIQRYQSYNFFRHTYSASLQSKRNSHALGPSISWDASLPVVGNNRDMTFTADWGLNAAVLFGRQRAHVHHQTSGYYHGSTGGAHKYRQVHTSAYVHGPYERSSSRAITIPNVGGFVGGTLKFVNAKISLGYRADFFFGAADAGIDTAKKSTVGFYGPFATISIGFL